MSAPAILVGGIPTAVRAQASALGFQPETCLFAAPSDLTADGSTREAWLLVETARAVALTDQGVESGPFDLTKVDRVRMFQRIGNSFLQFRLDGMYVDVVHFTNGRREIFGRVRAELDRLIHRQPIRPENLTRATEQVCPTCALPLPSRGGSCPRCAGGSSIFARALGLIAPYRLAIVALLVMMLLGVGLDLIPPHLTQILVDQVFPQHDKALLLQIVLALVAAAAGRMALNICIGRTSSLIGTRITRELRERLQAKLVSLSVEYYNRHSAGGLMSRVLWDVDYFQGLVSQVAQGFLLNIFLVVGIGIVVYRMNPRLALFLMLPIPFVVVGTMFFWKYIYPRYYRLWDSQSKMSQLLAGLLNGIRLVKSFGQEDREKKRFSDAAGNLQTARRGLEMSASTFNPIMGFVFGLGTYIIWYAGGGRVLTGELSVGQLIAFIGYAAMFYGPISTLSMFSNWVTGFISSAQRVFEVLDAGLQVEESGHAVRLPRATGEIEFRNVTFGYDPYSPVLKNISFKIAPGQFVGIVGKSGSGKTTMVNLICRFYDPQEGQVLLDGHDVRELAQDDVHRHVALVLQEPFLFRATIRENIAYGRPEAPPLAIMDAARAANAHDFIAARPAAYDTRLGEQGAGLSGGERQRISIARALLCDPRILILDEATSSVDTESEQEIQRALARLCAGRTTLAIAHRLSTLKNADTIYVIDNGRLVESGPHEELMKLGGLYHKLVKIQTELTRLDLG